MQFGEHGPYSLHDVRLLTAGETQRNKQTDQFVPGGQW